MQDETAWIEILKAGTWTASNGAAVTFSLNDLDAIATAYDPTVREAPLVFGHPETNHPAYGWVTSLKRAGDILLAKFKQVPEAVQNLVANGRYKKVSVALMPDKKTLRHVGLLGAAQPAVAGLADVKFSEDRDTLFIEFSNNAKEGAMDVADLEKQLAEEKAARLAAESRATAAEASAKTATTELSAQKERDAEAKIAARIDDLVKENKLLPADKSAVKAVALALGKTGGEIELSEGSGKKALTDHLFDLLSGLPVRGMMTEFTAPAGEKDKGGFKSLTGQV